MSKKTAPTVKSPFLIMQEFISPLQCEQIVDSLQCYEPDVDRDLKPMVTRRTNENCEHLIFNYVQENIEKIEEYYDIEYRGMKPVEFSWYAEEFPGDTGFTCDNAVYKKKQWFKNKDRDLTGLLFLTDHNEKPPFESEYEVYGGKVEFPQHRFGFNAERGTLIVFPSDPHFLHRVDAVGVGDLFFAKFHIASAEPFYYDPEQFPGDYTTWFQEFA